MGKSFKIINVVGARPNFIKAAPVVAALQHDPKFDVRLIHTGQHYDKAMSEIFFKELNLPEPNLNLGVGTGSHAQLTSEIMVRFEKIVEELPDIVECYKVSGAFDYFLRFVCADMASYQDSSEVLLKSGPAVSQISSHVVLARSKIFAGYHLERLL